MDPRVNVQDWHVATVEGTAKPRTKTMPTRSVVSQEAARARRLEFETTHQSDTPAFKLDTVSKTTAQEIRDARARKKMTQKQLAMAINEPVDVVRALEDGRLPANGRLLVRVRMALAM